MVILIGIIIFAAVIGFYACFGRRINENIGSGFRKRVHERQMGNGRIMKECRWFTIRHLYMSYIFFPSEG